MKLSKEFLVESLSTKGAVQINVKNDRNIDVPINVVIFDVEISGMDYGNIDVKDIQPEIDNFDFHFYNDEYKVDHIDYYESLVQTGMWKNDDFDNFIIKVETTIENYIYDNIDDFIPEPDVPDDGEGEERTPFNWG